MHSIQGRLGSLDYTKPESFIESAKDLNYLAKIIDNFDRKSRSTRDDAESLNRVGKDLRELIRETETLSHELSKNNIPEAGDTQLAAKNLIVVSARQMKFVDQLASIVRDYTRRR
jgi:hypothetical protein